MIIHTVSPGESIFSIARQYGVPPTRLITDNLLTEPGQLVVGQDILVLFPTITHTVRGGDTLSGIASQYDTTLLNLYQYNPALHGQPQIFPGQVLNIAYPAPPNPPITVSGYAYPNIDPTLLRQTLPYLTYLSVFSYGFRDDGSLILPTGDTESLYTLSHGYAVSPIPVLTSLTENGTFSSARVEMLLQDDTLQSRLIENLTQLVEDTGSGGVDVDFEYIPAAYAEAYAQFLDKLKVSLGNKTVFVSLAPKTSADQSGSLYEGHNYRLLGEAADRALVMTYEWGYTYGPPRAVSPLPEVRRVLDYAVTEIPPEKLLMGVPNYGYDWALPYVRGETKARSLGNVAAVTQAWEKQAAITYNERESAPTYRYYDRPETYADAVEHEVWFQNARSSLAQLSLLPEYGIGGIGVWNLMRPYPALWTILTQEFDIEKVVV